MARFDLTDFEWSVIQPLLPNKPRAVARVDDRRVLNGIFWRVRSAPDPNSSIGEPSRRGSAASVRRSCTTTRPKAFATTRPPLQSSPRRLGIPGTRLRYFPHRVGDGREQPVDLARFNNERRRQDDGVTRRANEHALLEALVGNFDGAGTGRTGA